MATILLTDEEYAFVKQLKEDMQKRIPHSSPRAATHFTTIANHCMKFLAKEDGKRAQRQTLVSDREQLEQAKQARRAQAQTARAPGQSQPSQQSTQRPETGRTTQSQSA